MGKTIDYSEGICKDEMYGTASVEFYLRKGLIWERF